MDNMTVRIVLTILLLFFIVVLLCSCGKEKLPDRLLEVSDHADCEIYVEYVRFRGGYAIAPLFNSYSAPLIYPGFDGREDRI